MSRTHIFFLVTGFAIEESAGGPERLVVELARHLDKTLFDVTICGLWRYGGPMEERRVQHLAQQGIQTLRLAPRPGPASSRVASYQGLLASLPGLRAILRERTVDVLHSHGEGPDLAAVLARRASDARVVMRTAHNEREWWRWPIMRNLLIDWIFPLCFDAEVCVSQAVVDKLGRHLSRRLLGKKPLYIPNAVNLERFTRIAIDPRQKRLELGLRPNQPVVGIIGRLARQKGHVYFLQAAHHLLGEIPNAQFLVIGTGSLLAGLEQLAGKPGLAGHIRFLGPRDDVEELLPALDVLVSSSLWEGLSTVVMEGMAAGVPVVATDVSGSRELITDGVTGLLVPPADAMALARAIQALLADPAQARHLAEAARRRAAGFSIRGVAERHQELYLSLLARAGSDC